jgi:hypothetical protein
MSNNTTSNTIIENSNNSIIDKRFTIVLCEIHNPNYHGICAKSDKQIANHFLVYRKYDCIDFTKMINEMDNYTDSESDSESDEYIDYDSSNIFDDIYYFQMHIERDIIPHNAYKRHPFIRNYEAIISDDNYIKPEIAEVIYLSSGECIAILKTFWIRIIQRTWKRVYKERQNIFLIRKSPLSLRYRERNGK